MLPTGITGWLNTARFNPHQLPPMKTALFALLLLSACTAAPKPTRPDARAEALERRVSTLLEQRAAREWEEPAPVR